jgi:hypothetical protein
MEYPLLVLEDTGVNHVAYLGWQTEEGGLGSVVLERRSDWCLCYSCLILTSDRVDSDLVEQLAEELSHRVVSSPWVHQSDALEIAFGKPC